MVKIKDVLIEIEEEKRSKLEGTIDASMNNINCNEINWREFNIYKSSLELFKAMLSKMEICFLLPIAEKAKLEKDREVIIFCSGTECKEDEIWIVKVNATELHCNINFAKKTMQYLIS